MFYFLFISSLKFQRKLDCGIRRSQWKNLSTIRKSVIYLPTKFGVDKDTTSGPVTYIESYRDNIILYKQLENVIF